VDAVSVFLKIEFWVYGQGACEWALKLPPGHQPFFCALRARPFNPLHKKRKKKRRPRIRPGMRKHSHELALRNSACGFCVVCGVQLAMTWILVYYPKGVGTGTHPGGPNGPAAVL
jgi:hypothetical protein